MSEQSEQSEQKGLQFSGSDVRQRIMDAAGQLFADKGYSATSITDITEAAGVGRALIYYYFKDKRDLHDSILQEGSERMVSTAEAAYAFKGSAFQRLRQFAILFRQLHIDRPNDGRIAMRADLEGNLSFDVHAKEVFGRVFAILGRIVEEGIAQGEFRAVDPKKAIHFIMGIVHSLSMMQIRGDSHSPDADIDLAMSILADGIAQAE